MNAKTVFSAAVICTAFSLGAARGQTPGARGPLDTAPPPGGSAMIYKGPTAQVEPLPPGTPVPNGAPLPAQSGFFGQSSWIRGDKYACCDGGCGNDGPIQTELFSRIGPSIVAGNGTIADVLQTGLYLGIGGRSLFFDASGTCAWTVELGLTNISNHAHAPSYPGIPLTILVPQNPATPVTPPDPNGNLPPQFVSFGKNGVPGVTLRQYNRTFFDVGVGREYYLWGATNGCGPTWRIGYDGGGRWGSAMAQFNEIRHRTDVIGGLWLAAHTDFEYPCGCCVLLTGFRVAYSYTWSDILQIQNQSDVQDVSLIFNFGVRY